MTFAQVLTWLFRRFHDITVATPIGFMIGSLREIWPWKETLASVVDPVGEIVPLVDRNVLPPLTVNGVFNTEIALAGGAALLGMAQVIGVERIALSRTRAAAPPRRQPTSPPPLDRPRRAKTDSKVKAAGLDGISWRRA